MDFSLVCKLGFVNGWCLYGGSRLWGGGLWWFEVVWGGLRWWRKGCKMERKWRQERKMQGKLSLAKVVKCFQVFQGLVFIEFEHHGCPWKAWRPTVYVRKNGGKISHLTCHLKAWFKAWLGMVQGMARYGSLNDKLTMWNAWQGGFGHGLDSQGEKRFDHVIVV